MLYQEDIAPAHTTLVSRQVRKQLGLRCLEWIPQSPDANCTENARGYLKLRFWTIDPPPKNKAELFNALKHAWESMPKSYFAAPVTSMPPSTAAIV